MPLIACLALHVGPTCGAQVLPLDIPSGRVALFLSLSMWGRPSRAGLELPTDCLPALLKQPV